MRLKPIQCNIQGFGLWKVERPGEGVIATGGHVPRENLVVDSGLDFLWTSSPSAATLVCYVGTGNSTPTAVQTDLDAPVANTLATGGTSTSNNVSPFFTSLRRDYIFSVGTASGQALAEFGFFNVTGGKRVMFSRLLFLDLGGSPTTIVLGPLDVLTITYDLRIYPNETDVTGTLVVNDGSGGSTNVSYTLRPSKVTSSWSLTSGILPSIARVYSDNTAQPITGSPIGTAENIGGSGQAYVQGSFERGVNISASLAQGNTVDGMIGAIELLGGTDWQVYFTPRIAKDNTKTIKTDAGNAFFTVSWARGVPS